MTPLQAARSEHQIVAALLAAVAPAGWDVAVILDATFVRCLVVPALHA